MIHKIGDKLSQELAQECLSMGEHPYDTEAHRKSEEQQEYYNTVNNLHREMIKKWRLGK